MRILHAATECYPFVKVGGLGDVMAALPKAQLAGRNDVRLLLPGYPALLERLPSREEAMLIPDLLGQGPARVLLTRALQDVPTYVVDHPLFNRPGGPYDEHGDSALKFGAFSWVSAHLAQGGDQRAWRPDILHLHDWQTGLAPVYLGMAGGARPRTVMTIHNLAYQGLYDPGVMPVLGLPEDLFHMHGVEFHNQVGFLKAGLQHADRLTTVSPTYAREIQTPAFGAGLEGLLTHRAHHLVGILNGVEKEVWHPSRAEGLAMHYSASRPGGKRVCKNHLQALMELDEVSTAPLFGVIARLTPQKGLDLLLEQVDRLVGLGAQLALLGAGDPALEGGFAAAAARHPGRVAVRLGFDEPLARRILAGADGVIVPSRFEPCGLTQMYALAFGALPVVRSTGGLADTVVDISCGEGANGFVFADATAQALGETLERAVQLYQTWPRRWTEMARYAMKQDFGWKVAAAQYSEVYGELLGDGTSG